MSGRLPPGLFDLTIPPDDGSERLSERQGRPWMVTFHVLGRPAPGGSKKGFVNPNTGRVIVTEDNRKSKPWHAMVKAAAVEAMGDESPVSGALEVTFTFSLRRPKGHYGTGRNEGVLKGSALRFPITRPDATKLVRPTEDACTGIVWRDDAQIVVQHALKVYHDTEGVVVHVRSLAWNVCPTCNGARQWNAASERAQLTGDPQLQDVRECGTCDGEGIVPA